MMRCDCCGKRRGLFQSFAAIETKSGQISLCSDCNDLAYKMRDAIRCGEENAYRESREALARREKNPTEHYLEWKAEFVSSLEKKLSANPDNEASED